MFNNLFGKKETPKQEMSLYGGEVTALEMPEVEATLQAKPKTGYDPIIMQIHKEFETSADKLLQQALEHVNGTKHVLSKEKSSLLKKHGFRMTKEVLEQNKIDKEEALSKSQIEIITYYKQNYPFNKFIFPDQVKAICEKYNLVFGNVSSYKGFVPEKNIKEIDNFKLKEGDVAYYKMFLGGWRESKESITKKEYDDAMFNNIRRNMYHYSKDEELMICAPIHDMNTNDMKIEDGYKLVPLDPVVLQPVRGGGFLVLTAWGDESKDPIIQNEILN